MFTINHDYRSVTYLEKDMLIIDRDRKYISFRQDKIFHKSEDHPPHPHHTDPTGRYSIHRRTTADSKPRK
jgi:hypothetical protein